MLKTLYEIILEINSERGFTKDGVTIKCRSPLTFTLSVNEDQINLNFDDHKPEATFEKDLGFIKPSISVLVLGILLKKNSGVIKLKNFVDIPFNYE